MIVKVEMEVNWDGVERRKTNEVLRDVERMLRAGFASEYASIKIYSLMVEGVKGG